MNLKYIFLPKPDADKSTAMKRVGLVCYWLGAIWFVSFVFVFVYLVVIETPVLVSSITDTEQTMVTLNSARTLTLIIEGQEVTVDDKFLSLSPDEQAKTVDEIAQSLGISAGANQANDIEQLSRALINADKAGDVEAAKTLAREIQSNRRSQAGIAHDEANLARRQGGISWTRLTPEMARAELARRAKEKQRRRVAGAWEGIGFGALLFLGLGIPGFFVGRGLLFILANR